MSACVSSSILDLRAIEDLRLDWRYKGVPSRAFGVRLGDIGTLGLNVLRESVPLPAGLMKRSALQHNSRWMRGFLDRRSLRLCPHGKTTLAPQLFELQLQDGAWGITAATIGHVRIYRAHGVQRILFANQLVAESDVAYVLDEIEKDPAFDFYCLVDSVAGLERMASVVERRSLTRPLQVLLEMGAWGGRTGARTIEEALRLAERIANHAPGIALRGIEAFEGIFGGYDHPRLEAAVEAMMDDVVALARQVDEQGWFAAGEVLLTAGGSAFFDLVATRLGSAALTRDVSVVLRSGCYLTHDSHHYQVYFDRMQARTPDAATAGDGLRAALEIVAYIQSTPEPGSAIASFGKRDASYDIAMPAPLWWYRPGLHRHPDDLRGKCEVSGLNDQHAYLRIPAGGPPLRVGDLIGVGISHPCTTFDKWQLLLVVDDDYNVVGGVRTFF